MEGENKKYQIGTKENKEFLEEIRKNLLEFGRQFPAPDGSSYYLGDDGTPWKDRNRETWITSRMLHVYRRISKTRYFYYAAFIFCLFQNESSIILSCSAADKRRVGQ